MKHMQVKNTCTAETSRRWRHLGRMGNETFVIDLCYSFLNFSVMNHLASSHSSSPLAFRPITITAAVEGLENTEPAENSNNSSLKKGFHYQ